MKRAILGTAICLSIAAASAAEDRSDYLAALDEALRLHRAETKFPAPTSFDMGLARSGTIVRTGPDGQSVIIHPELVAIYNVKDQLCIWGYDSNALPALPRTAALAVQGAAASWPAEATDILNVDKDACKRRSYLATLVGNLDAILIIRFSEGVIFFGLPPTGGNS